MLECTDLNLGNVFWN